MRASSRSEEHTSELQSLRHLVCRLLLPPAPSSTLFPYTTLFRSRTEDRPAAHVLSAQASGRRGPRALRVARGGKGSHRVLRHVFQRDRSGPVPRLLRSSARCAPPLDRKSTRLNSSHLGISYAVFCCPPRLALHSFPTRRSSDLGPKTAQRLTFFLLKRPVAEVRELSESLVAVKDRIVYCGTCFNVTDQDPCRVCSDPARDARLL